MINIFQNTMGGIVLKVDFVKEIVLTLKQIEDLDIEITSINEFNQNNFDVFYYKTYPPIKL